MCLFGTKELLVVWLIQRDQVGQKPWSTITTMKMIMSSPYLWNMPWELWCWRLGFQCSDGHWIMRALAASTDYLLMSLQFDGTSLKWLSLLKREPEEFSVLCLFIPARSYSLVHIEFSTFSTVLTFPECHTVGTHHCAGFSITQQCAYKFPHVSPWLDRSFIFIMNNILLFGNII